MEGRVRRYGGKVPVVYYLCKNRNLEHPHFIEVSFSSPEGLFLKDVINRLVVLRGRRMPKMYSWSCKRSYKSGFVWQDLSEEDLILPTHGNEYILKGSELLDQATTTDRLQDNMDKSRLQNDVPQQQDQSTCSRILEASSSYSSPISTMREGKSPSPPPHTTPLQEYDNNSIPLQQNSSPERGFSSFGECRVFILSGAQDASTQTEERKERRELETRTRVPDVSIGDGLANNDIKKEISPTRTMSSASSGTKIDTLETLIRAEVNKFNSFKMIEEEAVVPTKAKLKRTNALLQLLTCGSRLVKDHHSLGFISTYKPRFLSMRLGPTFPSSMTLREIDYVTGGSRVMRLGTERRASFSRNLDENYLRYKEDGIEASPSFSGTSLYNGDVSPDLKGNREKVANLVVSNSPIQNLSTKSMLNGKCRSPILDGRSSLAQQRHDRSPSTSSLSANKTIADVIASKGSYMRVESNQEETERTIKIEERLASGARIIIQSRVPPDYYEKSSDS